MHTTEYKVKGFEDVRIHHNGGWDGDAEVCWTEPGKKQQRAVLPAVLLLALGKPVAVDIIRDRIISTLDQI
jgi:hypothetical protein